MANGKKKGNRNERSLANWWQAWSGIEFSRVPASGGLRWQKKDDISGDIICTDPRASRRFPFSIETKSYKDINFEHLVIGLKNIKVLDFWQQAKEDGLRSDKVPILFMRYNGMPKDTWLTVITFNTFKKLISLTTIESTHFVIHTKDETLVLINSSALLQVDYKEFIKLIKISKRNGKI